MGRELWLAAVNADPIAVTGVGALLLGFAGLLLRELTRSSGGAWRVVRECRRDNHRLRWEVRLLVHRMEAMEDRLRWELRYWQQHGTAPDPTKYEPNVLTEDPGRYVPPGDGDL